MRQTEYIAAGVVALYIAFMTRPAPAAVAGLLASPVAQLVALAGIIYVGAKMSLLVAMLLGVAFVASVPRREYLDDASVKPTCKDTETYDAGQKKCIPKPSTVVSATAAEKNAPAVPAPVTAAATDKKDHFTLMGAPISL